MNRDTIIETKVCETTNWNDFYVNVLSSPLFFGIYEIGFLDKKSTNKKELNSLNYVIVYKKRKSVFSKGFIGEAFEIKFRFENKDIFYIYTDDLFKYSFILSKNSIWNKLENGIELRPEDIVENIISKKDIQKSVYKTLYYEMVAFKSAKF